jgi:histidine triad (HIT) family protein
MSETIFEKILKKQIPAQIVYEDDAVLAFRDINPQAPVHVLVIPKSKSVYFSDLAEKPSNEVGIFFQKVAHVAKELGLPAKGYRVVLNQGSDGGQTVDYLHAHILGGRAMHWPPG